MASPELTSVSDLNHTGHLENGVTASDIHRGSSTSQFPEPETTSRTIQSTNVLDRIDITVPSVSDQQTSTRHRSSGAQSSRHSARRKHKHSSKRNESNPQLLGAPRTYRLRTHLAVVLSALVVLAIGLTWGLSYATSSSSVSALIKTSENAAQSSSIQIQRAVLSKVSVSVEDYIANSPLAAHLVVDVLRGGQMRLNLDPGIDAETRWMRLKNILISMVKAFDVTNVYLGGEGVYFVARRENQPDGKNPKLQWGTITRPDGTFLDGWYSWNVNWDTQEIDWNSTELSWKGYEPHKRPWFQSAADSFKAGQDGLAWTAPYIWQGAPPFNLVLGLSATIPLDVPGVGVVACGGDFTLAWISQFLRGLDLRWAPNGALFLVERIGADAGNLIATTSGKPYTVVSPDPTCTEEKILSGDECGIFERLSAAASPVPIVGTTASHILEKQGSWDKVDHTIQYTTTVPGLGLVSMTTSDMIDPFGLEWVLVIAIPDDDILGEINREHDEALQGIRVMTTLQGVMLGIFIVLSTIVAFMLANRVARPMRRLEKGMAEMKQLDFEQETTPTSRITEISSMQKTYQRLRGALKNFQHFLPPVVVNRVVHGVPGAASLQVRQTDCSIMVHEIAALQNEEGSYLFNLPSFLSVLELHLTNINSVVVGNGGIVCDFNADQVCSVWTEEAMAESTLKACRSALEAKKAFHSNVKKEYVRYITEATEAKKASPSNKRRAGDTGSGSHFSRDSNKPRTPDTPMFCTCIHTGIGVEGNIGSPELMQYNVVGELRTFVSSLLTQSRWYKRPIIISEAVYNLVKDLYYCYPLDRYTPHFLSTEVTVYELVGDADSIQPAQLKFFEGYKRAFKAFTQERFAECIDVLESLRETDQDFAPVTELLRKCRQIALSRRGQGLSSEIQVLKAADIEWIRSIGFGGFSEVFLANWQGVQIAVKKMKVSLQGRQSEHPEELTAWRRELVLWSKLRHPNIVFLIGEVSSDDWIGLATEYLPGGTIQDLYRRLRRNGRRISTKVRLSLCKDVAAGMHYLHTREPKIIHRDLKSSNVLLDDQGRAKVADFGVSKEVTRSVDFTATGTPHWMAPEVIRSGVSNAEYDERSDVYSFGMLVWELVTSSTPWHGEEVMPLLSKLVNNPDLRPAIPAKLDLVWRKLITRCWATDPLHRPTFESILAYLNDIKVEDTPSTRRRVGGDAPNLRQLEPSTASLSRSAEKIILADREAKRSERNDPFSVFESLQTPPAIRRHHSGPLTKPPTSPHQARDTSGPRTAPLDRALKRRSKGSRTPSDQQSDRSSQRRVDFEELDVIIHKSGASELITGKAASIDEENPSRHSISSHEDDAPEVDATPELAKDEEDRSGSASIPDAEPQTSSS